MSKKVKPIPDGYHAVTPHIIVDDAMKALEFYKKAFGAEEHMPPMKMPDGKVAHAEIRIGDSVVMLSDEMPPMPGQTGHPHKAPNHAGVTVSGLFLYVKDADATFDRAVKAGCKVRSPLMDMFWGDRYGQLTDPFGHTWAVGTHIEDVPPQEIGKRQVEFMKKMAQGGKP